MTRPLSCPCACPQAEKGPFGLIMVCPQIEGPFGDEPMHDWVRCGHLQPSTLQVVGLELGLAIGLAIGLALGLALGLVCCQCNSNSNLSPS